MTAIRGRSPTGTARWPTVTPTPGCWTTDTKSAKGSAQRRALGLALAADSSILPGGSGAVLRQYGLSHPVALDQPICRSERTVDDGILGQVADWVDLATRDRRDGMNADDIARSLLAAGASPIDAIKAIRTTFEVDLGKAKVVVHRNLPAKQQAAAEQLWDVAEAAKRSTPDAP